jgi:hypothetical protein
MQQYRLRVFLEQSVKGIFEPDEKEETVESRVCVM